MSSFRSAALLILLAFPPAEARPRGVHPILEGVVIGVVDGDTLDILDSAKVTRRVRLLGIDAPERGQPFGKVARQVLRDRVILQEVRVLPRRRDRYRRLVGKVLLEGRDVNLELVREGLAWHYRDYAKDQFPGDAARYAKAEEEARLARRGLWGDPEPVPPWLWRKAR